VKHFKKLEDAYKAGYALLALPCSTTSLCWQWHDDHFYTDVTIKYEEVLLGGVHADPQMAWAIPMTDELKRRIK
jgi:hypothetical protein